MLRNSVEMEEHSSMETIKDSIQRTDLSSLNPVENEVSIAPMNDGLSFKSFLDQFINFTCIGTIDDDVTTDTNIQMNVYIDAGNSNAASMQLEELRNQEAELEDKMNKIDLEIATNNRKLQSYESSVVQDDGTTRSLRRSRENVIACNNGSHLEKPVSRSVETTFSYFIKKALRECAELNIDISEYAHMATDGDQYFNSLSSKDQIELKESLTDIAQASWIRAKRLKEKNELQPKTRGVKSEIQQLLLKTTNQFNQLFFKVENGKVSPLRKKHVARTWVFSNVEGKNIHFLDRQNRVYNVMYTDEVKEELINRIKDNMIEKLKQKEENVDIEKIQEIREKEIKGVFIIRDTVLARPTFKPRKEKYYDNFESTAFIADHDAAAAWQSVINANLNNLKHSVYANYNSRSNFQKLLEDYSKQYDNRVVHKELISTNCRDSRIGSVPYIFTTEEFNVVCRWLEGSSVFVSDPYRDDETPYGRMTNSMARILQQMLQLSGYEDINKYAKDLTYMELINIRSNLEELAKSTNNNDSKIYRYPLKLTAKQQPVNIKSFRSIEECLREAIKILEEEHSVANNISIEDVSFIPIETISQEGSKGLYHFESDYLFMDTERGDSGKAIHPARAWFNHQLSSGTELDVYIITHDRRIEGSNMYSFVYSKLETYNVKYNNSVTPGLYRNGILLATFYTLEEAKQFDIWKTPQEARSHGYTEEYMRVQNLQHQLDMANKRTEYLQTELEWKNKQALQDYDWKHKLAQQKYEHEHSSHTFDMEAKYADHELSRSMKLAEFELKAARDNNEFLLDTAIKVNEFKLKLLTETKASASKYMYDRMKYMYTQSIEELKYEQAKMDHSLGVLDNCVKLFRIIGSFF